MGIVSGVKDFFGLDIGTDAVRVVQLRSGQQQKILERYGAVSLPSNITQSDARPDQQKLVEAIQKVITEARISTRNVAVGINSNRVFSAVVDLENLSVPELAKTIQYRAESFIPTPLKESKIDWALLGESPADRMKVEVLISSVPIQYVEKKLDLLESIGLNVIAFEPDSVAITRSLLSRENINPTMIVDMGSVASDIVIALNGTPRLVRSIPVGNESLIKAATQNLSIDHQQAEQFVYKFGLSKDKLEGQIYNSIVGTVDILISEIEKSLKFFQSRYANQTVDKIIVSGGASVLPELPLYIANKVAKNVEIGNAWRSVSYPTDRQNELMVISNKFSVAVGLAERNE